ncbi:MAG: type IV toxin-antitoxin system AbiEi family antitoxin domain-containing protein [bacterium]|nr:type IV toxin-antitoxin system AbiEi family antitoxin domain-containing protein [bacterium]
MRDHRTGPSWDQLYETAATQAGHFTTAQAAAAGYSPQLLAKYLANGRVARARRGVYRLVHFPADDHEEFAVVWLWSERAAVFSHETALFLHGLSDALPSRIQLTLPGQWRRRRLRAPDGVATHFGGLSEQDRAWVGPVPVTGIARTLIDCAQAGVSPEIVRDAMDQVVKRGLIREDALPEVTGYLSRFLS